jgi:hypothetical protein
MWLSRQMRRRVDLSASAILKILVLASVAVSLLWLVGVDGGAMMILLGSLAFVGGLSALVWVPWLVVQAWIAQGDGSSPRSIWLPVLFIPFLVICALFGAAVGSMVSVIGGLVLRTIGVVVRAVLMPVRAGSAQTAAPEP